MLVKYEPIKFNSWQELAKYVIDGGEVYIKNNAGNYARLEFDGRCFGCGLNSWLGDTHTKKQPTLEELIAIKPRLIWVWDTSESEGVLKLIKDPRSLTSLLINWNNFRMLTDDEIKQFLDKEPA